MSKLKIVFTFITIFILLFNINSFSQKRTSLFEKNRISGATANKIDTLQRLTTEKLMTESEGLLEREIDPDKYIVGPGDILTISYISNESRELKVVISPEGKLIIPGAGVVNLKDLN
jgi:protein involved in polysaccharide export with SLBB domain